jgi:hypothetical protein
MTITPPPDDTPSDDMPDPTTPPDEVPMRDEPGWEAPGSEEGMDAPMRMPGDNPDVETEL